MIIGNHISKEEMTGIIVVILFCVFIVILNYTIRIQNCNTLKVVVRFIIYLISLEDWFIVLKTYSRIIQMITLRLIVSTLYIPFFIHIEKSFIRIQVTVKLTCFLTAYFQKSLFCILDSYRIQCFNLVICF